MLTTFQQRMLCARIFFENGVEQRRPDAFEAAYQEVERERDRRMVEKAQEKQCPTRPPSAGGVSV